MDGRQGVVGAGPAFLPLFGALIIAAAFSSLSATWGQRAPNIIAYTLSIFFIIAIAVVTFVITIQRFSKNLIGDEGYLMFTLPTRPGNLIFSKLFAAAIWQIVSVLVVFLAVGIMLLGSPVLEDIAYGLREAWNWLAQIGINNGLVVAELIIAAIAMVCASVLTLYCCIAIGMLANRHRGLLSFAAFIVISVIEQIISSIVVRAGLLNFFDGLNINASIHAGLWLFIGIMVITGGIFYLITRYMLKNKLNLE